VKSLLLGSAAGLIAVAGAQAADLPVKAKAVEYVKICSLYGVGYYYIPGTDTCIKIGGYVRWEGYHNAPGGAYPNTTPAGYFTRNANTFAMQARFRLSGDIRTQTEYGTLRAYFAFGVNALNPSDVAGSTALTTSMERAFIQFAGFTIGRSDTFFAFYNGAAYGLVPMNMDGSSGPAGLNVFAYTWQFGNGLSASLSIEDAAARSGGVYDVGLAPLSAAGTGLPTAAGGPVPGWQTFGSQNDVAGTKVPDIVANLRVDQAWGSAQIMGSLHQVSGKYWNISGTCPATQLNVGNAPNTANTNSQICGGPDDKWGWAVGAGLTLKMPWDAKDTLSGVIAYSEGHVRAVGFGMGSNLVHKQGLAGGIWSDGIFGNPNGLAPNGTPTAGGTIIGNPGYDGSIQLTTAWGGTVAFEHYWTPSLRTSWVFGYTKIEYGDTAKQLLLNPAGNGAVAGGNGQTGSVYCKSATIVVANGACDPDWAVWRIASRTMWNPVANLDVGLEVAYTKVDTAFSGTGLAGTNTQNLSTAAFPVEDQSFWTATLRVQRSFWP